MSLQRDAIRILRHLKQNGLDDIFVSPLFSENIEQHILSSKLFRNKLLKSCRKTIEDRVFWEVGLSYKFSIPKTQYSYRNIDWIDIEDVLRYTALVFSIAPTIEQARIPINEEVVYSYRFSKYGHVLNPNYNYKSFREKSDSISKTENFKVKISTDISNFYDRLNLHRLESNLASLGCDKKIVSCLNELLFFWADRNSYGLPIGGDASRLLAEATLIPIDNALRRSGVKFIRFVDDYRIFASSYAEGHAHLNLLIQELDKESLFINTSKTTFVDLERINNEVQDEQQDLTFDPVNEKEKKEENIFTTVGYVSKIIKTYRYPGAEKIAKYKSEDLDKLKNEALIAAPASAEAKIRYFIRCFIYNDKRKIEDIITIIDKYIHLLTYTVDALIKEASRFSDDEKRELSRLFQLDYQKYSRPPYYSLAIIRLLTSNAYRDVEFIRRIFVNLELTTNPIFLREFILLTRDTADRDLLLVFRRLYKNVCLPVRRAIFYVIDNSDKILDGEKRAWFKQVHKSEIDDYLKTFAGKRLGRHSLT